MIVEFKTIFEALPGHFLILEPNSPNYAILAISDELLRITGRERKQTVGKSVFEVYPENPDAITGTGPATLRVSLQKAIETKQPNQMPVVGYQVPTADGVFEARYGSSRTKPVLDQAGEVRYLIHSLQEKNDQVLQYNEAGEVDSVLVLSTDITERKRAEEALRESEEKYRTLFDAMDEGFFLCEVLFDQTGSPVDIHYREANPAAARMVGEGFTGRRAKEIRSGDEACWYDIFGWVARSGQAERGEHYARLDQKWYTFNVFSVGDEHSRKVAVLFRDTTRRKRREANLAFLADVADAMSRLSTVAEIMATVGAKIGAYLQVKSCSFVDMDDPRGEITVFDAWSTANVSGLRSQTLRLSDFMNEELARAGRAGEVVIVGDPRTEGRDHTRPGIAAYVNVPFHRQGVWTNNLAITDSKPRQWRDDEIELFRELANRIFPRLERARAEAALRESEQRFRLMADAVPQIVWITDPEGHNDFFNKQWFLYTGAPSEPSWEYDRARGSLTWSEGMYRLFGLPTGSPIRVETYLDYALEEDLPVARKMVEKIKQQRPFEETLRIKVDGQEVTLKIKAIVQPDPEGGVGKMLGVDVDLSQVKRLEQENLRLHLQQQQQLLNAILEAQEEERRRISESLHNGVGQILYATKLNLAGVNLAALPARKPEVEARLHKTEALLTEAIVETRRVSHELVPVLLKEFGLQKATEEFCSRFARTGIQIDCHCFPERLPALLETAIYRISQELVNNIFKHSGATRANLEVSKDQDFVYLDAQDNGKGIDLSSLVGPSAGRGRGIGLSTIRDRVKLLNGTLEIDSTPGKGTLITIRLPLKSGAW